MRKLFSILVILCLFILPCHAQNIYNGNITIADSATFDRNVIRAAANTGFEYRFLIDRSFSYMKSFTVGSNVTMVFTGDGYMTMTGFTMTVSGAIEAPYVQITDGTITYSSANDEYYNPVWVGSTGNLVYQQGQDATIINTAAGGATGAKIQISQSTTALTGTLIGIRGNARVNIGTTSAAGTVQGAKFQAGNMDAGYNMAVVTGTYVEIVNKIPDDAVDATVVWTHARALELNLDLNQGAAGKTSTFTNATGIYMVWNLPTAGTYTTVTNGYGILMRNEQVGGNGQALDAAFYVDDLNMGGGIKGWDYGIDFSGIEAGFGTADFRLSYGETIAQSADDMIEFQGASGSDDTDLRIDLDGTYPVIDSPTDGFIGFTDDLIIDGVASGLDFVGAYSSEALDFSNVTLDHGGSSGPVMIRAGSYGTPVASSDPHQSGMIRLYGSNSSTTDGGGGFYDRGIFVYNLITGNKSAFPIAGLVEVRNVGVEAGPVAIQAAQFIVGLHTSTAKLAATATTTDGMFGSWNKVYSVVGSVAAATSRVAPIWLDNQMSGTVSGEEYGIFATTGGTRPDGFIGFETTSSGYDQFIYCDATYNSGAGTMITTDAVPGGNQDARIKVYYNGTQYYIPLYR